MGIIMEDGWKVDGRKNKKGRERLEPWERREEKEEESNLHVPG